jgi:hypothetical protein
METSTDGHASGKRKKNAESGFELMRGPIDNAARDWDDSLGLPRNTKGTQELIRAKLRQRNARDRKLTMGFERVRRCLSKQPVACQQNREFCSNRCSYQCAVAEGVPTSCHRRIRFDTQLSEQCD